MARTTVKDLEARIADLEAVVNAQSDRIEVLETRVDKASDVVSRVIRFIRAK